VKGPERGKIKSEIARNLARRSEVENLMDESNILLDQLKEKMMGASNGSN
jgi:hypothetical protein